MSLERNRQPTAEEIELAREKGVGPASPQMLAAVEQFNAGEYFDCHETLEILWRDEPTALRRCYQGLLHIAVGLLHAERRNRTGALTKLRSGASYLEPFRPVCCGVNIEALLADAARLASLLEAGEWPEIRHITLKSSV